MKATYKLIKKHLVEVPFLNMDDDLLVCIYLYDKAKRDIHKFEVYEKWEEHKIKDINHKLYERLMLKHTKYIKGIRLYLKDYPEDYLSLYYCRQALRRDIKTGGPSCGREWATLYEFRRSFKMRNEEKITNLKQYFSLYESEKIYIIEFENTLKIGRTFPDDYLKRVFSSAEHCKSILGEEVLNCYILKTNILRKEIKSKSKISVETLLKRKFKDFKLFPKKKNSELFKKGCLEQLLYEVKILSYKNPYFEKLIKLPQDKIIELNTFKTKKQPYYKYY